MRSCADLLADFPLFLSPRDRLQNRIGLFFPFFPPKLSVKALTASFLFVDTAKSILVIRFLSSFLDAITPLFGRPVRECPTCFLPPSSPRGIGILPLPRAEHPTARAFPALNGVPALSFPAPRGYMTNPSPLLSCPKPPLSLQMKEPINDFEPSSFPKGQVHAEKSCFFSSVAETPFLSCSENTLPPPPPVQLDKRSGFFFFPVMAKNISQEFFFFSPKLETRSFFFFFSLNRISLPPLLDQAGPVWDFEAARPFPFPFFSHGSQQAYAAFSLAKARAAFFPPSAA